MGQIEDLQAKGFGSHGGKTWVVENDIVPLKKRVLVTKMKFGEIKTKINITYKYKHKKTTYFGF